MGFLAYGVRLVAAAVLSFGLMAPASNASVIYADSVVNYTKGTVLGSRPASRYIPTNALGAPDTKFVALGLGGSIILSFPGTLFGGPGMILEVTNNAPEADNHFESADIFASLGAGPWVLIGQAVNPVARLLGGYTFSFGGPFDQIKIVDTSKSVFPGTTSFDGFDVDSISVSPIPVPAAGLLLLTGLGAVAALRRRKV